MVSLCCLCLASKRMPWVWMEPYAWPQRCPKTVGCGISSECVQPDLPSQARLGSSADVSGDIRTCRLRPCPAAFLPASKAITLASLEPG